MVSKQLLMIWGELIHIIDKMVGVKMLVEKLLREEVWGRKFVLPGL